jgi:hypothetical protein
LTAKQFAPIKIIKASDIAAAVFVALFVISVVLSAQLCAVMGKVPCLSRGSAADVEAARQDRSARRHRTAYQTRYQSSEFGIPARKQQEIV